ncbi:hypothetical protein VaNZ11_013154 [Volvox africanus]|uniref:Uncharacterized protein n=1 Tax=Volvox africanus TaxID=51714 RepID=A0ABQ5SFY1_9CHLO|nr:hypothetical protein VaNZ11_013154 [Volvox africanus]
MEGGAKTAPLLGAVPLAHTAIMAGTAAAARVVPPAVAAHSAYGGTRAVVRGTRHAARVGGPPLSWPFNMADDLLEYALHVAGRIWNTWLALVLLTAILAVRIVGRTTRALAGAMAAAAEGPAKRMVHHRQVARDRLLGSGYDPGSRGVFMAVPGPVMHLMLPAQVGANLLSSGSAHGGEHSGAGLLSYILAPAVMAVASSVAAADVWAWRIRRLFVGVSHIFPGSRTKGLSSLPIRAGEEHVGVDVSGGAACAPSSYPPTASIAAPVAKPASASAATAPEPVGAFRLIPPIPVAYPGIGENRGITAATIATGTDDDPFTAPADAFAAALDLMGTATRGGLGNGEDSPQHRRSRAHDLMPYDLVQGMDYGADAEGCEDVPNELQPATSMDKDRDRQRSINLDALDTGTAVGIRSRHEPHHHHRQHEHDMSVRWEGLKKSSVGSGGGDGSSDAPLQLRRSEVVSNSGALTPPDAATGPSDRQYPAGTAAAADVEDDGSSDFGVRGRFFGYTPMYSGLNDGLGAAAAPQSQREDLHSETHGSVGGALASLGGKLSCSGCGDVYRDPRDEKEGAP